MKPWHSLFRNRNGGLCVVCTCLVLIVCASVGTWSGLCWCHRVLFDFPRGFVELIGALSVVQGFKNLVDARYATPDKA